MSIAELIISLFRVHAYHQFLMQRMTWTGHCPFLVARSFKQPALNSHWKLEPCRHQERSIKKLFGILVAFFQFGDG